MEFLVALILIGLIYYLAEKGARIRESEENNSRSKI